MKCPSCGESMPESRSYCQYCGWQTSSTSSPGENDSTNLNDSSEVDVQQANQSFNIDDSTLLDDQKPSLSMHSNDAVMKSPEQSAQTTAVESTSKTANQAKKKFCKYCGGSIDQSNMKCVACGKKLFIFPIKNALLFICAILIVAALFIIFNQRETFSDKEEALKVELSEMSLSVQNLETSNSTKDATIDSLNSQISSLKNQVTSYKGDSETLSSILSFLQNKNTGSASSKFKASDKIFIVDRQDTQTSFILTCDFPGSTSILTSRKGSSADIIFSQDRWYGPTTKLFINPNSVGTTIITFSNDQNTQTFKIMIIVTD